LSSSFAEWRGRCVDIDYHVDVEGHFYSVPDRFARAEVEARLAGLCTVGSGINIGDLMGQWTNDPLGIDAAPCRQSA
jgi:hypothetical protein